MPGAVYTKTEKANQKCYNLPTSSSYECIEKMVELLANFDIRRNQEDQNLSFIKLSND